MIWPAGVGEDGWCWCRAARLRVWPCPSPSRIFDRDAAPTASLTASLRHGIGRMEGQAKGPASGCAAQPSIALWPLGPIWDHTSGTDLTNRR